MHVCEGKALVAASGETGEMTLFDASMRSTRAIASLHSHQGGVLDIGHSRTLLATCGLLSQGAIARVHTHAHVHGSGNAAWDAAAAIGAKGSMHDPLVRVYDLRMMRATSPISLSSMIAHRGVGPIHTQFMAEDVFQACSAASGTLLIGANDGRLWTCDPFGDGVATPFASIDPEASAAQRHEVRAASMTYGASNHMNIVSMTMLHGGRGVVVADSDGIVQYVASPQSIAFMGPPLEPAKAYHSMPAWLDEAAADATPSEPTVSLGSWSPAGLPKAADAVLRPTATASRVAQSFAAEVNRQVQARMQAAPRVESVSDPVALKPTGGDALLLAGAGWEVPLEASGLGQLFTPLYEPWSRVWSVNDSSIIAFSRELDLWLRTRSRAHTRGAVVRASTLPEFFNDNVMLPRRRRDIDPALIALCDRSGTYINNTNPALNLKPNSMLFSTRRAWMDMDPRHRGHGESSLGLTTSGGTRRSSRADSLSSTEMEDWERELRDVHGDSDADELDAASDPTATPTALRRPRVKGRRLGVFEFDFSTCNPTEFAGLEELGPNSFVNAALIMLFFLRPLRRRTQRHLCALPACLTCECRFVFDILAQAADIPPEHRTATAQNFMRALTAVTEAGRLNLLHPSTLGPCRRMEALIRVMLERINKDMTAASEMNIALDAAALNQLDSIDVPLAMGMPDNLMRCEFVKVALCERGHALRRTGDTLCLDMMYPSAGSPSFSDVLASTFLSSQVLRGWCDTCKDYAQHTQKRAITNMPHVLCLNTAVGAERAAEPLWTPVSGGASMSRAVLRPSLAMPLTLAPTREDAAPVLQLAAGSGPTGRAAGASVLYHLVAIVAHVPNRRASSSAAADAEDAAAALARYHYVSCVRVDEGIGCLSTSAAARWLVFNDFMVTRMEADVVLDMLQLHAVPCTLVYARAGSGVDACPAPGAGFSAPVWSALRTSAGFLRADAASTRRVALDVMRVPDSVFELPPSIPHQPLLGAAPLVPRPKPMPQRGDIVAVDAEFVAVSLERSHVQADGTRVVVAHAIQSPGRVTVVDATARTLFDHYIARMEHVKDYLTRFSGLQPGDLDASTSRYRLHTFKDAYMKLRYLVDAGCVFVGHGLRKDCRTLNLFIPSTQIIDTVNIFKLPGQRHLSLRFLAAAILGMNIQSEVHDSGEDALMALRLYVKYQNVLARFGPDRWEMLLQDLYDHGRASGFKAGAALKADVLATDARPAPAPLGHASAIVTQYTPSPAPRPSPAPVESNTHAHRGRARGVRGRGAPAPQPVHHPAPPPPMYGSTQPAPPHLQPVYPVMHGRHSDVGPYAPGMLPPQYGRPPAGYAMPSHPRAAIGRGAPLLNEPVPVAYMARPGPAPHTYAPPYPSQAMHTPAYIATPVEYHAPPPAFMHPPRGAPPHAAHGMPMPAAPPARGPQRGRGGRR